MKLQIVKGIKMTQVEQFVKQVFSDEEIEALFAAAQKNPMHRYELRDTAIVALLLDCGLRAEELRTLTIGNVTLARDVDQGHFRIIPPPATLLPAHPHLDRVRGNAASSRASIARRTLRDAASRCSASIQHVPGTHLMYDTLRSVVRHGCFRAFFCGIHFHFSDSREKSLFLYLLLAS